MKPSANAKPIRKIKRRRHLAAPLNHRKKMGPKAR